MLFCVFLFFFFQAEDGIRDLVRSRGLGDVYKRQVMGFPHPSAPLASLADFDPGGFSIPPGPPPGERAVSYTHLTLPTSDLV